VAVARENAVLNDVADKVRFFVSDSYTPSDAADRRALDDLAGRVGFVLANPPSSEGDDGFGFRRKVLAGALPLLRPGGIVFLSISAQYGRRRIEGLCQDVPGFRHEGLLASTDWVPFDLGRPDLLDVLHVYAAEETRGGFEYAFRHPGVGHEESMNAGAALAHFERTGESPLSRWQTHLYRYVPR
jgi:hypothetical protein